jgi:hypothetical protein
MSALASTVSASDSWQAGFLAILPTVQTHARIQFRRLSADQREEAIQEAIASACAAYQLLAAQGKLSVAHPSTIADYAVRQVRDGRHVGGRRDSLRDVLSPLAHRRYGFNVELFHLRPGGPGSEGWRQLVTADRKTSVPDLAAFRIDFPRWLRTLTRRDRKIIAAFIGGDGTTAVASRFGVSPGRISQLRRQYERRWRVFHGEVPATAAA